MHRIKPSDIDLLEAAAGPFSLFNGTRLLWCTFAGPIVGWFNKKVPGSLTEVSQTGGGGVVHVQDPEDDLFLTRVPFGLLAMLALDAECDFRFCDIERKWRLYFRTSQKFASALEVEFGQHANRNGLAVGIKMTYSHNNPGELTVVIIPAIPPQHV
jgi:hypothetical protein